MSERLTLRAAAGGRLAATFARTGAEPAPGVVVLPDDDGLQPAHEALADAFAAAGIHALAIDLGGDDGVDAALAELRARGATRAYVLGFGSGGRAAFLQGTREDVAGVVGFHGRPAQVEEDGSSPVEEARAGRLRAPVLALYCGADDPAGREAFAVALHDAHVLQESVVYDGAPHGFFDRAAGDGAAEARADAWFRVRRFMGRP